MRVFCSSNNFLCQEIFSSEFSFSVQHRKQFLSELVPLEGFITFMDFQFNFLPIYIIHRTRISSSRKKWSKRKSINFSFNFLFFRWSDSVWKVPRNTFLLGKVPPDPTLIFFLWEILPRTSKCPRTPLFFIIFVGKDCPGPLYIWLRLPRTPLFFIFLDKKFCNPPVWSTWTCTCKQI